MKKHNLFKLYLPVFLLVTFLFIQFPVKSAWLNNQPTTITQPDGTVIACYASGDEFFNWLHDSDGFTIIVGEDGFYYYGVTKKGIVVPSTYRVNTVDPAEKGLVPWAVISKEEYQMRREEFWSFDTRGISAPATGLINNLVVYIRFADQTEFPTPRSVYDSRFNNPDGISLKHYFYEVSYQNLTIESHHYPISPMHTNLSYQDPHPRSYYLPFHAVNNPNGYQGFEQHRIRLHTLLMNAIVFIAPQVPANLLIDANFDGNVDNVCFIARGPAGNWADLLWAHRWALYSFPVFIHGKRVWDYTFQPENQNDVFVLSHEMFHVLGAPDLYHYNNTNLSPVGGWDLMESGFVHMGAYMKYKYADQNWITDIPVITEPGTYTLNPLTMQTGNAFKIPSPNSSVEFFVVEFRNNAGFYESNLPGTGMLIYRINPAAGNGNAQGPPDEVYIYRPNGTTTVNGQINFAHFSADVNRTAISDYTNPSSFLQDGSPGGLNIFNISVVGDVMTFDILLGYAPEADFASNVTTIPQGGTVSFTDLSTYSPVSWNWTFQGGTPVTSGLQNPQVAYSQPGIFPVSLKVNNNVATDSITKANYIIVGNPSISVSPSSLNVTLAQNSNTQQPLIVQSTGNTWLRYFSEWELETIHTGIAGTILGTYSNLPPSRSGLVWADGSLYILSHTNATVSVYDTAQKAVVSTFPVIDDPFSIAWDGNLLWVGNSLGQVQAYYPSGVVSAFGFNLPSVNLHTLTWDGEAFWANVVNQADPVFYRIAPDGAILESFTSDIGSRIMQLTYVPSHPGGHLWGCGLGDVYRLKIVGSHIEPISSFNAPSNISYSIGHDGTDLWWTSTSGLLFRLEDGLADWLSLNLNKRLLAAGLTEEFPIHFNSLRLAIGVHSANITINSNDPANPTVVIPVELTITPAMGTPEISSEDWFVTSSDGVVRVHFSRPQQHSIEVYDLTGRLVRNVTSNNAQITEIGGLMRNQIYLIRLNSASNPQTRRVIVRW